MGSSVVDWDGEEFGGSLIHWTVSLASCVWWLMYHPTVSFVDQPEGSSSGPFRPDLIEHFTVIWFIVKTVHFLT